MTNHVEYRICGICGGAIVLSGNSGIVPFKYCHHQALAQNMRIEAIFKKYSKPSMGVKEEEK